VLRLTGPDRLVFDFPGYELHTSKRRIAVNGGPVQDLRLSQFQAHPAVTRVVVDLKQPLDFEINSKEDRVVIEIAFPRSKPLSAVVSELQPDTKDNPAATEEQNQWEENIDAPADPELAEHYYQLAAERGVAKAQFRLGQLLARKSESPDNRVLAYKWLALAQASIKESTPVLNDLKKLMSPQEVEEAEHEAGDWRRTHREIGDQLAK
jgi:AMIN domain